MTPLPTKVLAIGIDAASPALLDQWIADGTLPNLRSLVEGGVSGRLGGVEGFFVGSTWPSLYTGTTPARHGVHYQLQIRPGTYELEWVHDATFVRADPLWRVLDQAGRRVAALDVPLSRPEPLAHGVQVVEWGGHDAMFGFHTSPAELGVDLKRRFGLHPGGMSCDGIRTSSEEYRTFLDRLKEGVRLKTEWSLELLARGGWDLFMQVFTEAHCTGHQCWHLHDPLHPAHDPHMADELGDPLREIYRAIDVAVGVLAEAAGDARVVVFSAHDMSYWYGAQFLLPEILYRLGVTHPREPPAGTGRLRRIAERAWAALPPFVKRPVRSVRRRIPRPKPAGRARAFIPADTERSLCFPLNNGLAVGGIRLNLAGREPNGVLASGAEADEFCERLTADLLEIRDERTAGPLISSVVRTADLYTGLHLDVLPDLLVAWSDAVPTGSTKVGAGAGATIRASSPRIGTVEASNGYGRTGEHRPGGWFVAAGPSLSTLRLPDTPALYDLAPTLAALLDVEMPDTAGDVIQALVSR